MPEDRTHSGLISVSQALEKFSLSRAALYRLISDGRVFFEKTANRTFLCPDDLRRCTEADRQDNAMPPRERYECHLFASFLLAEHTAHATAGISAETDPYRRRVRQFFAGITARAARSELAQARKWQGRAIADMSPADAQAWLNTTEQELKNRATRDARI